MNIAAIQESAFKTEIEKGFYEEWNFSGSSKIIDPRCVPTKLALIHSEVSEALEAYRKEADWKEHFAEELADVIIRTCGLAGAFDLDLQAAVVAKLAKNKDRPYKNGGRKC